MSAQEEVERATEPAPDEETLAEARRLFAEGVADLSSEPPRWQEAADTFEAALALHSAPPIHYNLAVAWVELGRFREASEQIEIVLASEAASPELRALSRSLADRIRRDAGRITVDLPSGTAGAEVTLDGEPLPETWLAREIPVSPGTHTVVARRGGASVASAEVMVGAGGAARVRLAVSGGGGAGVPLHEDWRFWLGVGGGTVAATVLIVILVALTSSSSGGPPVQGNFMPGVLTW